MKKIITLIYTLFLISCGGDNTTTGNPVVALQFTDFSTQSTKSSLVRGFAVNSLTMCFKRLRFKTDGETTDADPAADSDNIDLELGQVVLSSTGTTLASVSVPAGTYTRIEFDLEKDCEDTTASSVILDNDNDGGTPFTTDDRITIKFEGSVNITADQTLSLAIGKIITAADAVTSAGDIKDALEDASATGSF